MITSIECDISQNRRWWAEEITFQGLFMKVGFWSKNSKHCRMTMMPWICKPKPGGTQTPMNTGGGEVFLLSLVTNKTFSGPPRGSLVADKLDFKHLQPTLYGWLLLPFKVKCATPLYTYIRQNCQLIKLCFCLQSATASSLVDFPWGFNFGIIGKGICLSIKSFQAWVLRD